LPVDLRSIGPFVVEVKGMFNIKAADLQQGPDVHRLGAARNYCVAAGN